jgi:hypothetical protein
LLCLPPPVVDVYIAAAGSIDGLFTRPTAHAIAEVVAAICTFALGRPVNCRPPFGPPKTIKRNPKSLNP